MHQAIGNSLWILRQWIPPAGIDDAKQLVNTALANAMYATRASFHSGIKSTPGALVFNRDMVMNIPFVADLTLIRDHRQQLIDQHLLTSNRKRISYDYQPNQEVLKLVYEPAKLEPQAVGPYHVNAVHTNGTLTIQLTPYTIEHISIRRVKRFIR
jgi:hypothetical protein